MGKPEGKPADKPAPAASSGSLRPIAGAPPGADIPDFPAGKLDLLKTPEAVVEVIAKACDEMDALMADRQGIASMQGCHFARPRRLYELRSQVINPLLNHLDGLLNPAPEPDENAHLNDDPEAVEEAAERAYQDPVVFLAVALHEEPGKVPSWSRPGTFLVWFGHIPVLCHYRGICDFEAHVEVANPRALWMFEDATVRVRCLIQPNDQDVPSVIRRALAEKAEATDPKGRPLMKLRRLEPDVAEFVAEQHRARHPWLRDALRKGPVSPVPIPEPIMFAQPALMG